MVDMLSEVLTATWTLPSGNEIWLFPLIVLVAMMALVAALWILVAGLWALDALLRPVRRVWRWIGMSVSDLSFWRLIFVCMSILLVHAIYGLATDGYGKDPPGWLAVAWFVITYWVSFYYGVWAPRASRHAGETQEHH